MDRLEHLQEKAAARIGQLVPKDWKVDRLVVEHYSDSQAVLHYRLTSQRPNDLEGQTIRLSGLIYSSSTLESLVNSPSRTACSRRC